MTIKIQLKLTDEEQAKPLTRNQYYISALNNRGVLFVDKNPDFLLVHASNLNDEILNSKIPIVILERTDSTNIIKRSELKLSNVIGLIKNTLLYPSELNNEKCCHGRYHNKIIQSLIPDKTSPLCSIPLTDPHPKLTENEINKLHTGFGFCHYEKLYRFGNIPFNPLMERANDIHFIGTSSYGSNLLASYHRINAIEKINQLKNVTKICGAGRMQSAKQYMLSLLNTKIVLSPWGHGEACYRDFEALLCGCILLKPDSSFVNCWPNIYQNNKTYIPCKADFSDLQEKTDYILTNWSHLNEFRSRNLKLVQNAMKSINFSDHMVDIFQKCMKEIK